MQKDGRPVIEEDENSEIFSKSSGPELGYLEARERDKKKGITLLNLTDDQEKMYLSY